MTAAVFDGDHAAEPGWATYQQRHLRPPWRCLFGHDLPPKPNPANGHSPDNYNRCFRCNAPLKWYVFGQHRRGGMNALRYDPECGDGRSLQAAAAEVRKRWLAR